MDLRDFAPPILVEWLIKTKQGSNKLFNSYDSAIAECKSGYEENSVVTVVYEKTKRYRDLLMTERPLVCDITSLRTFVALSLAIKGKDFHVIDFGGACGAHYFLAKALLCNRVGLRWHVVETPSMANIASALEDGKLKFYDGLENASRELGRVDIVFTSYALPYVRQPYESLRRLTECRASTIFITRQPLSTLSNELIAIQTSNLSSNGPGPMPTGMKDSIT
jgi:putative methyltransferase (TIGR04325 family)